MKISLPIVFMWIAIGGSLLTVAGSVASYYLQKGDQAQKDTIQSLSSSTLLIAEEIKQLDRINNEISGTILRMSEEHKKVSDKNLLLADQSNHIITEVQLLTAKTRDLIKKIEIRTANEEAENLATGQLNFNFTPNFSPTDEFQLELGMTLNLPTSRIVAGEIFSQIMPGLNFEPVKMKIQDGKLVLSFKIFDPNGNLIAEVQNNHWRPNRNFYGRFNYDDNGFEVIDNQGNVAVSIDVKSKNRVSIQGVFRSGLKKVMVISSQQSFNSFPFLDTENEAKYKTFTGKDYNETIDSLIRSIEPVFEYFDKDWLHKRIEKPQTILTNPFFNPNAHINENRPAATFSIPFTDIIVSYKGVKYKANISMVDPWKPERILFRIKDWNNKPGLYMMMLEKTAANSETPWQNSRPLDIHDPGFISAAITALQKFLDRGDKGY